MEWHGLRINQRVITVKQIKDESDLIKANTKGIVELIHLAATKSENYTLVRFKGYSYLTIVKNIKRIKPIKTKRKRLERRRQNMTEEASSSI